MSCSESVRELHEDVIVRPNAACAKADTRRNETKARAFFKTPGSLSCSLAMALVWTVLAAPIQASALDTLTFHRDSQRTGWNALETKLTPQNVSDRTFGMIWESPQLDGIDGKPPHIYASPLYVDRLRIAVGSYDGGTFSVVFAATNAGFVYAINAFEELGVPPGTILWKTKLAEPCTPGFDGSPTGVLSTPVIDLARKRLYVTSCTAKVKGDWSTQTYAAYGLDITTGEILHGWPVTLDRAIFNAQGMNKNAASAAVLQAANRNVGQNAARNTALPGDTEFNLGPQRGALNLSPNGTRLYVTFGESIPGWLVAIDTKRPGLATTFSSVAIPHGRDGGIWGAGGPAVDKLGNVFVIAGTGFNGFVDQPHDWVQSALELADVGAQGFVLRGTYTPFNYCQSAMMDIDLGSGGALLIPDLDPATTETPQLMAFGGKQGNLYLVDRSHMPGRLDTRQPCSEDSSTDRSLLSPKSQPQFGKRGPLNVFGPYSEKFSAVDHAKSRSVPAYFRGQDGTHYLFASGNSKNAENSPINVPPCLARLRIVTKSGRSAYLEVDQLEQTLVLENPGSPLITSNGFKNPIVWVLDENARRSASLAGSNAPRPVLYALDALTLKLLWKSKPNELYTGGKYNEPAVARGTVFVGTDRIQAFGLRETKFE